MGIPKPRTTTSNFRTLRTKKTEMEIGRVRPRMATMTTTMTTMTTTKLTIPIRSQA